MFQLIQGCDYILSLRINLFLIVYCSGAIRGEKCCYCVDKSRLTELYLKLYAWKVVIQFDLFIYKWKKRGWLFVTFFLLSLFQFLLWCSLWLSSCCCPSFTARILSAASTAPIRSRTQIWWADRQQNSITREKSLPLCWVCLYYLKVICMFSSAAQQFGPRRGKASLTGVRMNLHA